MTAATAIAPTALDAVGVGAAVRRYLVAERELTRREGDLVQEAAETAAAALLATLTPATAGATR